MASEGFENFEAMLEVHIQGQGFAGCHTGITKRRLTLLEAPRPQCLDSAHARLPPVLSQSML